jgi:glycosyltransferase involved in cell wall biosynthesis
MSRPTAIERLLQTGRLLKAEGAGGVSNRMRQRLANRIAPAGGVLTPIARSDLLAAAEVARSGWVLPDLLDHEPGTPMTIAWVTYAPGAGSGGHTTLFRLVSALEQAGHRCIVYVIDEHGWALQQHERTIRSWWPWVEAEVRDAADGIEDAHAIFATGWESAYRVLSSPARGKRFYLVQDFEPWFYPAGSEALLAEATYRFGFHAVTAGRFLAEFLGERYGIVADHFDFGRDGAYRIDPAIPPEARTGICVYARPDTPRRATGLALTALDLLAARHPEVDIHFYGGSPRSVPFAATDHGLLAPEKLNALYNRCIAGLALSATNVSLVPHEMMAAGCIPVVNDAEHNRLVLDNDCVVYAHATPFELADALCSLVERPLEVRAAAAAAAAASVEDLSWDHAGDAIVRIVRSQVEAPATVGR